ncbi:uncharacterized protein RJT20DRAFT_94849 [Scheffersomyces xylosifermentans]|uniref:uncharacterized protein n=1 Tax=Scheffersomyces xylosifermentans TaxID=1304137 RepID=UPI00315D7775
MTESNVISAPSSNVGYSAVPSDQYNYLTSALPPLTPFGGGVYAVNYNQSQQQRQQIPLQLQAQSQVQSQQQIQPTAGVPFSINTQQSSYEIGSQLSTPAPATLSASNTSYGAYSAQSASSLPSIDGSGAPGSLSSSSSSGSTNTLPQGLKKIRRRRHTATVHDMTPETAERNRCRICNKQFKRPSSLQTHYYSHTGEKIFKCPWEGCAKLFSVKSNMTRHYRLHERDLKKQREKDIDSANLQRSLDMYSNKEQTSTTNNNNFVGYPIPNLNNLNKEDKR